VLAADKDFAGARGLLMEGLARTPGSPPLLVALVTLASREGGPEAAVKRAEELARDPANPAAAVLKGDVLMAQSHFAEAAAAFRAQLTSLPKDDPRTALLQIRTAQATAAAGKPDEAAAMLSAFVAAHPDSTAAEQVLSSLDLNAGRLPQARAMLETVLTREQNNVAALNNLAWIRQHDGDLPGARELATRAYLLRPTPATGDTLGWIVLAQGDVSDALPLLRDAAQDAHASPAIVYHYAAALARAGQKEAAVTRLKALLGNADVRFAEKPEATKLLADLQS
jgi:predicted Zn-dependent protease